MPTCDCVEIETELALMEDKVEKAKENKACYQNSLANQEAHSQMLLDAANSVSEAFGFDDIDDLARAVFDINKIIAKLLTLKGSVAAIAAVKAASKIAAAAILVALLFYRSMAVSSRLLELFYRNRFRYWSKQLEEREQEYGAIKDKLIDCHSSLTMCEACEEEYVAKMECGRACRGCGRWYCANCFDERIESAELAAGQAF